jgi:hypothetical protein
MVSPRTPPSSQRIRVAARALPPGKARLRASAFASHTDLRCTERRNGGREVRIGSRVCGAAALGGGSGHRCHSDRPRRGAPGRNDPDHSPGIPRVWPVEADASRAGSLVESTAAVSVSRGCRWRHLHALGLSQRAPPSSLQLARQRSSLACGRQHRSEWRRRPDDAHTSGRAGPISGRSLLCVMRTRAEGQRHHRLSARAEGSHVVTRGFDLPTARQP